ncbi:ABC transporter permease [Nesterenkonia xinjiangensis]|uniref:Peptide/nickel transport system permease protein n=1 Tax=Nesterenkonia xinjiangensis TaxID=225327 RepID=A0A7Z0GNS7_9MICC|nr:ABC transporter permease [Nesterenkonia xinjiangensis]NYJ79300.1 peptide/nickel transport system permease protein [Nesterenkonia xinjiangensis]
MLLHVIRRLGVFVLTVMVASVVVFFLLGVLPGDPARAQLGLQASEEQVQALRQQLGADRPLPVRYLEWVTGFFSGDMGLSYASRTPVAPQVLDALQVSLLLVLGGICVAVLIALPLGILSAVRHHRPDGALFSGLSQLGISVPNFLAGLLLIAVFAVALGWLPSGGWSPPAAGVDFLRHLALPALALGLVNGAILARYTRAAVLEVMREDFMRTARAKGLTPGRTLIRHGLRNALVPVVTVTSIEFANLIIGAVVIETVFVIPGLGSTLIRAVANRDLIMIQSIVMCVVILVLVVNLLVDLVRPVIDPRLRSTR